MLIPRTAAHRIKPRETPLLSPTTHRKKTLTYTAVYGGANLHSRTTNKMASASDVTDVPVLSLINKRIRNLRKKLNRIVHLEKSLADQGKSTIKNKDQEELLKSKSTIVAAINELENFRQPLSIAVDEEINLAIQHRQIEASENNGR
ncbi:hypothetical protein LXL04_024183 [Taraxacum kok-saghyz]